jgi:hypothetical protein
VPTGKAKARFRALPVSLGAWPERTPSRFIWVLPYRYREPRFSGVLPALAKLLRAFAHGWRLAASHEENESRQRRQILIAIAIEDAASLLEQRAFRDFGPKEEE